jgi:hypothetical protein
MYTLLVITLGDIVKLKELFMDYKFFTNWEEELEMANKPMNGKITQESALNNLLNLLIPADDENENGNGAGNSAGMGGSGTDKNKIMRIDKPNTQICGGMEKKEVF